MVWLEACSSMVLVSLMVSWCLQSSRVWHGNVLLEQPSQCLAPSKGCADLVFFWLFLWQNPQLFLSYIWLMFSTCCFLVFESFNKKRHLSLGNHCGCWRVWYSRFFEDFTSVSSNGFFCFKILQSFISSTVCDSSSTISGLDHCACLSYLVLGFVCLVNRTRSPQDKSQSQFVHTSSKRKEPKHEQKAGSLFYTEHNQQQTSQPKQSIISTFHYPQLQKILPDIFPVTHSVQNWRTIDQITSTSKSPFCGTVTHVFGAYLYSAGTQHENMLKSINCEQRDLFYFAG